MLFSSVSLLAMAATLATSVVATPISSEIETRDLKITKRSYAGTCKGCFLRDSALVCKCRNNAKVEVESSLDLNRCLANDNGVLVWRAGGGFYGSCGKQAPYQRDLNGSKYWSLCYNKAGDFVPTEVNLNDRIHNNNGVLRCDV